ncbi:MAG: hypothetical protein EOM26_14100 [Alphaproteobacteria bacterium]|nr:hypothetical protein [Alphaproteobacteria bacterium]
MERPEDERGTVLIRTVFGAVSVRHWFPSKTLDELVCDEDWREAVQADGGPFCLLDHERLIPF